MDGNEWKCAKTPKIIFGRVLTSPRRLKGNQCSYVESFPGQNSRINQLKFNWF